MIKAIKSSIFFYFPLLSIGIFSLIIIALFDKGEIVLWVNEKNTPLLDLFFQNTTLIGEAFIIILTLLVATFYGKSYSLAAALLFIIDGLTILLCKDFLFPAEPRPRSYITDPSLLHFVNGVDVHYIKSFPSGHTLTAFAGFAFISLLSQNKVVQLSCFFVASCVGLSRIYLAQHFLTDVFTGSILGSLFALKAYMFASNMPDKWQKPFFKI